MLKIASHQLGILQGSQMMFADYQTGGPMWTGDGPRESRLAVQFSAAYLAPPAVITAISLLDSDCARNTRVDLSAENVTASGFDLVFRTWNDSRIARIRADWTAFGPLPDDEVWDVD